MISHLISQVPPPLVAVSPDEIGQPAVSLNSYPNLSSLLEPSEILNPTELLVDDFEYWKDLVE
jgi:hypothetical protein